MEKEGKMNPTPIREYRRSMEVDGKKFVVKIRSYANPIKSTDMVKAYSMVDIEDGGFLWGSMVLRNIVEEHEVDGIMNYLQNNYQKYKL